MVKVITVPENVRDILQKANVERDSRRDILLYIMEHNDLNITPERLAACQKDYDEKYFAFETAKSNFEKEYVLPAVGGKANNWSLDYTSCDVTITFDE